MNRFRVRVARIEIVEIEAEELDVDDLTDSFMDDILDHQETTNETSDGKIEYVPKECISLEVTIEGEEKIE